MRVRRLGESVRNSNERGGRDGSDRVREKMAAVNTLYPSSRATVSTSVSSFLPFTTRHTMDDIFALISNFLPVMNIVVQYRA